MVEKVLITINRAVGKEDPQYHKNAESDQHK